MARKLRVNEWDNIRIPLSSCSSFLDHHKFLAIVFVDNTWFGQCYYAMGGNRIAAARLGISEFKVWVSAYGVSGGMAAITGIVLLGFSGGGFAGAGDPIFL